MVIFLMLVKHLFIIKVEVQDWKKVCLLIKKSFRKDHIDEDEDITTDGEPEVIPLQFSGGVDVDLLGVTSVELMGYGIKNM